MSQYSLSKGLFIYPTPLGAYYAISSTAQNKSRSFLNRLLQQPETPVLGSDTLMKLMDTEDQEKSLELLNRCQKIGWIQGIKYTIKAPEGVLEEILPLLLANCSETGKVLLADEHGFYLSSSGFPHEVAIELSVLSAEIATMHNKRIGLLENNLGIGSHAWSIVDAFGGSNTGFWPLHIGNHRFVIVISGIPHFNQADFVTLIWALNARYA